MCIVGCNRIVFPIVVSLFSCSVITTPCDPMDYSPPGSVGFPRREYWSGLPFPTPGDLPHLGIELRSPASPALAGGFFITRDPLSLGH